MKYLTLVLIVIAMGAQAQTGTIPISGDYCPFLYTKNGDTCVPREGAPVATVKDGECPEKMIAVGNYCVTPERVTTITPPKKD